MNNPMQSPVTTIIGVLTVLPALMNMWQTKTIDWPTVQNLLIGAGFVWAKDWNVSGR